MFNFQDENFNFYFSTGFDQLEFRPEQVDNNLTAVIAYYAYLIIGLDMDTMAPLGGSDILQMAMDVANSSQNLGYAGWKAFENDRNRFAIINDYLDGAMETAPATGIQIPPPGVGPHDGKYRIRHAWPSRNPWKCSNKPATKKHERAPRHGFTDIKQDELVSIYSGKGTAEEREKDRISCSPSNASQSNYWEKLRK